MMPTRRWVMKAKGKLPEALLEWVLSDKIADGSMTSQ